MFMAILVLKVPTTFVTSVAIMVLVVHTTFVMIIVILQASTIAVTESRLDCADKNIALINVLLRKT
jgi:hypothetical protein